MKRTYQTKTVPAPNGGLNTRDGIANMPPTDAVVLTNWIPDTYGVRSRKGYQEWATGFPGAAPVKSVLAYFASNTNFPAGAFLTIPTTMPGAMFAATDTAIYTVTSRTNSPASALALSGNANAGLFNSAMLANSAGAFLLACSEADGYFTYDGTTWLRRVAGSGPGEVHHVNPNDLVHVSVWKRRAWFVERNSTSAWYLPADAISGNATEFDFGPLFKRGGHLAFTANWTIDAGDGIDDYFVAVSSNGEVLVYRGTDPSVAANFALVGVWYVGQVPVGRRGYTQYGGDLLLLSTDGVVPLSLVTRGGSTLLTVQNKEYSSKIAPTLGSAVRESFTANGWQLAIAPYERILVVNSPYPNTTFPTQFVMSLTVNNWCLFHNVPIISMGVCGGYLFGGTASGTLLLLFANDLDAVTYAGSGGTPVIGEIKPAYNYFENPTTLKQFKMVRPWFLASESPGVFIDVAVNFQPTPPTGSLTFPASTLSVWNAAVWNSAFWGGGLASQAEWASATGLGFSGSAAMLSACPASTTLTAIDYLFEFGGIL